MIEAHLALIPGDNDIILGINYKALNPAAHIFKWVLIIELDVDVSPILIYPCCKNRGVFTLIIKIEGENAIDSCCDEAAVFVVEIGEVN